MKKILALALAASMMLSLAACGDPKDDSKADATSSSQPEEVEVEKELFDVVITMPADMVGETTQEELDAESSDYFHSAVLNEDGSVSMTMSKKQHKALMKEFAQSIDEELQEMIGSEDYPNITDIKANKDYTHFDVTRRPQFTPSVT